VHCQPGCPHVHFSWLRYMALSPAHCRYARDNGTAGTSPMHLGSLVHNLLLESGNRVVKFDGASRRGKAWSEFKANQSPDLLIATEPELADAEAMAASVARTPHAVELLHGLKEAQMDWKIGARSCRGTCDAVNGVMVELKTTADANPDRFPRSASRLGYYAQLPWYMDGHEAAGLGKLIRAFIIAVESRPPWVVQTFELTPRALDLGRRQYRLWFERLLVSEASNQWPGYLEGDAPLDAPEELDLLIDGEEIAVA
jgi:PDDEXK-like domain of unknown function (DUF3799)